MASLGETNIVTNVLKKAAKVLHYRHERNSARHSKPPIWRAVADGFNENGSSTETISPPKANQKPNGVQKGGSLITLNKQCAGEATIVYGHGADIETLMPELRHPDYYTMPQIQLLPAMERAEL
ncbi:unnamed protein product [Cuscuta campestris]|uniref:Uncharacterized protein n=1 Tax=Cuscuta campestris TaxID=132261 RepID=A0A484MXD3_9ASTE|nr:unnamed protein product [Cuscuta campestris]